MSKQSLSKQSLKKDYDDLMYDDLLKGSGEVVTERLTAMFTLTDCYLVSCDGARYPVHKAKLLEQSRVLRGILLDVPNTAEVPLHDDAAAVRLLISGMYDANSPVAWLTIERSLELARKYDVQDIRLNCEHFLSGESLTVFNLPRYMLVACTYDIRDAIQRCKDYIASGNNFKDVAKVHGADWCKELPGHAVTDLMVQCIKKSCPHLYT